MTGVIATIATLLAVLCATSVASTAAGGAEPESEAYEVAIYPPSPTNPGNILSLEVFPSQGVAVARTSYDGKDNPSSGVTYSVAMPAAPFDGSLDVDFPGLGRVVGTVAPTKVRGLVAQARICEEKYPSEPATFEGRISFHGAGDPRSWMTTRAEEASIDPACGAHYGRHNGPASVFRHLGEGPGFSGDFIRFFANTESRTRRTQFAAVGDRDGNRGTLVAYDTEWLREEIATQRWVRRYTDSFQKVLHFARHDTDPARVIVTPPAPFFGRATYLKRTGKLTGSLGAHFPGLKVRLAHPTAEVIFEDEEFPSGRQ